MTDYHSHCLRPLFTDDLIKILQQGISVNLIAQDGQGRRRLLDDIQNMYLKNTKIIVADMNSHRDNYPEFIQTLGYQLNGKNQAPMKWEELITTLNNDPDHIIIILHHFDELLDNLHIDNQFNIHFFNQLNELNKQSHIASLCVTTQAHDQSVVGIKDKRYSYLWLDLTKKRLPKLTYDEIQFELKNRNLSLSPDELSQITWTIHKHAQPYRLLNFFADKIVNHVDLDINLSERINLWSEQFKQLNNSSKTLSQIKPSIRTRNDLNSSVQIMSRLWYSNLKKTLFNLINRWLRSFNIIFNSNKKKKL